MFSLDDKFFDRHPELHAFFEKPTPSSEDIKDLKPLYSNFHQMESLDGEMQEISHPIHPLVVAVIQDKLEHFKVLFDSFCQQHAVLFDSKEFTAKMEQITVSGTISTVRDCAHHLRREAFIEIISQNQFFKERSLSYPTSPCVGGLTPRHTIWSRERTLSGDGVRSTNSGTSCAAPFVVLENK